MSFLRIYIIVSKKKIRKLFSYKTLLEKADEWPSNIGHLYVPFVARIQRHYFAP